VLHITPQKDVALLVITRIPTHRNDGAKISAAARRDILRQVRDAFGGYTLEGPFQGAWVADDGKVYEETSYRLEVIIEPGQLQVARALVISIGKQLGQRAMYFEVREGGEIIDIEEVHRGAGCLYQYHGGERSRSWENAA
jgi:hypothetical protein